MRNDSSDFGLLVAAGEVELVDFGCDGVDLLF